MDHEADLADGLDPPPPYTSAALPAAASTDQLLGAGRKNSGLVSRLLNLGKEKSPTHQSAQLVNYVTVVYGTSARQFWLMADGRILSGGDQKWSYFHMYVWYCG